MGKMIMGVGLPGSGKTTVLKPFAEKYSFIYISPDDIRAELSGDAADQSRNQEVWQEAERRVVKALESGETVVFDATFAKDFERRNFIRFAREHGATHVLGVFASVPLHVAHERNKGRERIVPPQAIERMHTMLTKAPPATEDGFDRVIDINELEKTKDYL